MTDSYRMFISSLISKKKNRQEDSRMPHHKKCGIFFVKTNMKKNITLNCNKAFCVIKYGLAEYAAQYMIAARQTRITQSKEDCNGNYRNNIITC